MLFITSPCVLIEPYWNVKQGCTLKGYNVYYVLIEPYWNVKIAELGMNAGFYVVLIEPYWNVKIKYASLL